MKKNRKKMNEARENILDKTIKVYDLNAFIDKEVNDGSNDTEYQPFHFDDGAAIIVTPDGDGCIVDYEAIGSSFNATSDTVYVDLCPKPGDDGNGHRTFSIMPTARLKVTVDELLSAPSKDMKVKDFFYKYDYNDRCRRNFDGIRHYLENASVVESKKSNDKAKFVVEKIENSNKKKSRKHLIIEDVDAAMKDINANMEQPTTIEKHVALPPAYASAVEDHEKTREHIGKVMKQLRDDANKVIAKNPGTGKKISRKPYTEVYELDESLFEDFDGESLSEALDDVEWKGATADIIAQIKKYNPNATYKITSRKSDDYMVNGIYISLNDKPNRSFLNDLIKKYNLKKTSIDTFCSRTRNESPYIRITPYLGGSYGFDDEPSVYDYYVYVREFNGNNKRDESLVTEKRNNCRDGECEQPNKEKRANRFAQKAAHKEKNDKRDELEESAFNNKIRYYTKSMIPLSLSNLFFMGTGRGPVDIYDAVEDSDSVDELTAKLRDIVDDEIALDRKTDDYVRYTVTDPFGNVSYLKIAIVDNLRESVEKCPDCGKEICECENKKKLAEASDGIRTRQLVNNIEALLYEYDNSITDGYWEPFKNDDELINWTYGQIFNLKDDGHGWTVYRDGICDDLKYLGKEYIINEIKRIGHEIGVVEENGITESKQPEIFECPICHRNFTLGECEHDDLTCQCPRCHSELIKTDNGEYTEIEESANLNEMTSDEIFSARQGIFDKVANRKNQKFKRREDKEEKRLRCLDAINDIIRAEKIDLNNIDSEAERILDKEDKYEINTLKEYIDLYGRDKVLEMIKDQLRDENNIKSSQSESLEEDFNLTISLSEFEPWTDQARETWEKIMMTDGAFDRLEWELELEYPEGMSETGFNDLLRFESDWVLQAAGIEEKPAEDEDDDL